MTQRPFHLALTLPALAACGASDAAPPDDPAFTLVAEWSPIAESHANFHLDSDRGLDVVLDPGVAVDRADYTWSDVAALMPPRGTKPGDVWEPDVEPVVALLRQLHPSASAKLHHHHVSMELDVPPELRDDPAFADLEDRVLPNAPLGARATLLADGPVVDVLLRAHVEFHLEGGSVFYTPAQFEGRLVVEPSARRVVAFHLAVPDRNTNVDLNVHEPGEEFGDVDIGYVPRLGLWTDASPPKRDDALLAAARSRLRAAFYPFAAVDWPPLELAYLDARERGRPMHVIVLFGSLDDESC